MAALHRAGLISPGLERRLLVKASESSAGYIHIELEDGVPADRKQEARATVVAALQELDWRDKVTLVRINAVDSGFVEDDLDVVSAGRPTAFLQAKCQGPDDIRYIDRLLTRAEKKHGIPVGSIRLASMIERARALSLVDEIATASPRMMALYLGPSDLGNEFGYRRSYHPEEIETLWARSRVIFAAHTAGLIAIDAPYLYFQDMDGTRTAARWAYRLGFDVKTCVSPRQIDTVNEAFAPSNEEIAWAREVLRGEEVARQESRSVWLTEGMMVDAPFVTRARSILESVEGEG